MLKNLFFSSILSLIFFGHAHAIRHNDLDPIDESSSLNADSMTAQSGEISFRVSRHDAYSGETNEVTIWSNGSIFRTYDSSGSLILESPVSDEETGPVTNEDVYNDLASVPDGQAKIWPIIIGAAGAQVMCYVNARNERSMCMMECSGRRQFSYYRSGVCGFNSTCLCY